MEFEHETGRYFKLDDAGTLIAEVTYQPIDDDKNLVIDHTFVDPVLRGQGVAAQLVRVVVSEARANGQKIEPLCTFARHEFDTKPEYADVWRPVPEE